MIWRPFRPTLSTIIAHSVLPICTNIHINSDIDYPWPVTTLREEHKSAYKLQNPHNFRHLLHLPLIDKSRPHPSSSRKRPDLKLAMNPYKRSTKFHGIRQYVPASDMNQSENSFGVLQNPERSDKADQRLPTVILPQCKEFSWTVFHHFHHTTPHFHLMPNNYP